MPTRPQSTLRPPALAWALAVTAGCCSIQALAMNGPDKPLPREETKGDSKAETKGDSKAETKAGAGITLAEAGRIAQIGRLRKRPGLDIPNPPFSLKGLVENRKMKPEVAREWALTLAAGIAPRDREAWLQRLRDPRQAQLPSQRYMLFHGTGMASLRRLLGAYYDNVDQLGSADVFALAPWVTLGLRNAISSTLIDVTDPQTWYQIGFLFEVPLECFWKVDAHDAMLPMEGHPYDQRRFRNNYSFPNYTKAQGQAFYRMVQAYAMEHDEDDLEKVARELRPKFEQDNKIAVPVAFGPENQGWLKPPADLFGLRDGRKRLGLNEVGFFSRIEDPRQAVRIIAVAITDGGSKTFDDKPDDKGMAFYEQQARDLAKRFGIPFYDLRLARKP